MPEVSLLIAQSFIVSGLGSYWDYSDYIFCLRSNPSLRAAAIRLNLESGGEWIDEFSAAAEAYGFSDIQISASKPQDWRGFMLSQCEQNASIWTMPWPGDHIYIGTEDGGFLSALKMGERLGADAVVYSHVQDFDYLLDWRRIKVLYNDQDYVMIKWGAEYLHCGNRRLQAEFSEIMPQSIKMPPVPGFVTYRSDFFIDILKALPDGTRRWQDMEYSGARCANSYNLLIPKRCLYRHVHGYWIEGFFKCQKIGLPLDVKKEVESWYLRPNYNWRMDTPHVDEYREFCMANHPYFARYFKCRESGLVSNRYGMNPFDSDWVNERGYISGFLYGIEFWGFKVMNYCKRKIRDSFK